MRPLSASRWTKKGVPSDAARLVKLAHRIIERAESIGIRREDMVMDCLNLPAAANPDATLPLISALETVKKELGVNMTLGLSNVSFGLPDRDCLNGMMLTIPSMWA